MLRAFSPADSQLPGLQVNLYRVNANCSANCIQGVGASWAYILLFFFIIIQDGRALPDVFFIHLDVYHGTVPGGVCAPSRKRLKFF